MKTHTDDKRHTCEVFIRVAELKHHMTKHDGERPHRCPTCSKSYTILAVLRTHMKTHDIVHTYGICGKTLPLLRNIKKQMKKHFKS